MEPIHYQTSLFRGWDYVRLSYALDGDAVMVRERRALSGQRERRVALSGLSGEVRRVFARHPANRAAFIALLLVLLALGMDFVSARLNNPHRDVWVPLWVAGAAVGAAAAGVWVLTRKPLQWTHFRGRDNGQGLFILADRRNADAYGHFVAAVTRQAELARRAAR